MICVTVTPTSRTLAKVDILNASAYGDMVEVCLDHLRKEPDFTDLMEGAQKPILFSCRRPQEGGHYKGSDEDRITLLRRAIIAKPDYIELDCETAAEVPRFGDVKRVVSFTNLKDPEADPKQYLEEAKRLNADVVKFVWPLPTLEDAWPLLAAATSKSDLPIVGHGLERESITFTLLGLKHGAPWTYAALEPGMEIHEGQRTIMDLGEWFRARDIDSKTSFVGVTGTGPGSELTCRAMNAAFDAAGMNAACLPLEVRRGKALEKQLGALNVKAILAQGPLGPQIRRLVGDGGPEQVDVLLRKSEGWKAYETLTKAALDSLEKTLGRPWGKANAIVFGTSDTAAAAARRLTAKGAMVSVCGVDDAAAAQLAREVDARDIPLKNLYSTLADLVVIGDADLPLGPGRTEINPAYLRETMTVLDLTDPPIPHPLASEAKLRGCKLVDPVDTYLQHLAAVFKVFAKESALPEETITLVREAVAG